MTRDGGNIEEATRLAFPEEVAPRSRPPEIESRGWAPLVLQLLLAQVPIVRRNLWPASAIVMAVGFAVTAAAPRGGTSVFAAITPLVAAAGLAFVYGADNDPSLEIALATVTSPRAVLLARLVLVCGYDLVLALIASVAVAGLGHPVGGLEALILSWLGPMLLLSSISLAVAVRFGTAASLATAAIIWVLHLTSDRALEQALARAAQLDPLSATALVAAAALVIFAVVVGRVPGEFAHA